MGKNYCTSTCISSSCSLRRDYSYATNSTCLDCKFCCSKTGINKTRLHLSKYIDTEQEYSKELYYTPVSISRYCEPFLNKTYIKHSLYIANKFLDEGSQVIFKTRFPDPIIKDLPNKENIQIQIKFFNTDTLASERIRSILCPNTPSLKNSIKSIVGFEEFNKVCLVDPYIIGINDIEIKEIINKCYDNGIQKVILKQLFATDYFKTYLNNYTDKSNLLTEKVGKYFTYRNETLCRYILPIVELCYKKNIDISFCMNNEINTLIMNKKYNNCCLFENPNGIYNITKDPMYRHGSQIIKLKEK